MKTKFFKLLFVSVVFLAACDSKYDKLEDGVYADIETKNGSIILELYAEDVPMTVANFITLAEGTNEKVTDSLKGKKFYDGLKFHRVVKNFIVQGGDILGNGRGNPGYSFKMSFLKTLLGTYCVSMILQEFYLWPILDHLLMEVNFLLHIGLHQT